MPRKMKEVLPKNHPVFGSVIDAFCLSDFFKDKNKYILDFKKFLIENNKMEKNYFNEEEIIDGATYRFAFNLNYLDSIDNRTLEYIYINPIDKNLYKYDFFKNFTDNNSIEHKLLETYLKPIVERLKAFEIKLKEMNHIDVNTHFFNDIRITFITIDEIYSVNSQGIHKWHTDKDVLNSLSSQRQFSFLFTEHPQTEFTTHKIIKQEDREKNVYPIFQCPSTQPNSTSYWTGTIEHRKPIFSVNPDDPHYYKPIRSMVSIIFNFKNIGSYTKDYYDSHEHIQKEKNALNEVFGNISNPIKKNLNVPSLIRPSSINPTSGGRSKKE